MFQLVLTEPDDGSKRDVGENVFLDDLEDDYKVYLFYYPGALPNESLEVKLKEFGESAGGNLFVNIGRLNDPKYDKISSTFQIRELPVIIMTGIEGVASLKTDRYFSTVYARLDNKELLKSEDLIIKCVQRLFNLFNHGEVSEILNQARHDQSTAVMINIKRTVVNAMKEIWQFLLDRDISVSLVEGKFEIKRSTGLAS